MPPEATVENKFPRTPLLRAKKSAQDYSKVAVVGSTSAEPSDQKDLLSPSDNATVDAKTITPTKKPFSKLLTNKKNYPIFYFKNFHDRSGVADQMMTASNNVNNVYNKNQLTNKSNVSYNTANTALYTTNPLSNSNTAQRGGALGTYGSLNSLQNNALSASLLSSAPSEAAALYGLQQPNQVSVGRSRRALSAKEEPLSILSVRPSYKQSFRDISFSELYSLGAAASPNQYAKFADQQAASQDSSSVSAEALPAEHKTTEDTEPTYYTTNVYSSNNPSSFKQITSEYAAFNPHVPIEGPHAFTKSGVPIFASSGTVGVPQVTHKFVRVPSSNLNLHQHVQSYIFPQENYVTLSEDTTAVKTEETATSIKEKDTPGKPSMTEKKPVTSIDTEKKKVHDPKESQKQDQKKKPKSQPSFAYPTSYRPPKLHKRSSKQTRSVGGKGGGGSKKGGGFGGGYGGQQLAIIQPTGGFQQSYGIQPQLASYGGIPDASVGIQPYGGAGIGGGQVLYVIDDYGGGGGGKGKGKGRGKGGFGGGKGGHGGGKGGFGGGKGGGKGGRGKGKKGGGGGGAPTILVPVGQSYGSQVPIAPAPQPIQVVQQPIRTVQVVPQHTAIARPVQVVARPAAPVQFIRQPIAQPVIQPQQQVVLLPFGSTGGYDYDYDSYEDYYDDYYYDDGGKGSKGIEKGKKGGFWDFWDKGMKGMGWGDKGHEKGSFDKGHDKGHDKGGHGGGKGGGKGKGGGGGYGHGETYLLVSPFGGFNQGYGVGGVGVGGIGARGVGAGVGVGGGGFQGSYGASPINDGLAGSVAAFGNDDLSSFGSLSSGLSNEFSDYSGGFVPSDDLAGQITVDAFSQGAGLSYGAGGGVSGFSSGHGISSGFSQGLGGGAGLSNHGLGSGVGFSSHGLGGGAELTSQGLGVGAGFSSHGLGGGAELTSQGLGVGAGFSSHGLGGGTGLSSKGLGVGTGFSSHGLGGGAGLSSQGLGVGAGLSQVTKLAPTRVGSGATYGDGGVTAGFVAGGNNDDSLESFGGYRRSFTVEPEDSDKGTSEVSASENKAIFVRGDPSKQLTARASLKFAA
ncbi:hypothetical protein FHG87_013420 [Trinorchestia longiramus]|nr:hypothetical protein FHG87_013420 [Trinorchestia longiramus]